ncbi:hypothetical protein XENOCAPTIV_016233 [Xenoophorus captivus]|uniref:HIRAN domain-containing protein n=1 Tax=Xenoophorus captivus TaxID=1517983 RepID=A0ABV0QWP9_9TELE
MVGLVREPHNPYDRNAVMVTNVLGRQVGHIKKELAAAMAYVMDQNLAKLKNAFDNLFEGLMQSKDGEKEAAEAVATPLLPHQKQALSWMCARENKDALPPFWEKRGELYYNSLTCFSAKEIPERVRGGILADDMGLDQFEQHLHSNMKLNIYLYYGSERNRNKTFLSSQDVVITTYNVLSTDFGASTPIQNSVKDLWMLLAFLRLKPFDNLVKCITLRRTKNSEVNGRRLVSLPKKSVYVEEVVLSQQEREEYELARNEGRRIIGG